VLQLLISRVSAQAHTASILTQPGLVHIAFWPGLGPTLPQQAYQAITGPRLSLVTVSAPDPDPNLPS